MGWNPFWLASRLVTLAVSQLLFLGCERTSIVRIPGANAKVRMPATVTCSPMSVDRQGSPLAGLSCSAESFDFGLTRRWPYQLTVRWLSPAGTLSAKEIVELLLGPESTSLRPSVWLAERWLECDQVIDAELRIENQELTLRERWRFCQTGSVLIGFGLEESPIVREVGERRFARELERVSIERDD